MKIADAMGNMGIMQAAGDGRTALRKSAQEFESLLVGEMFKAMRRTVPDAEGQGSGMAIFNSMLDEELSRVAARVENLGFAEQMERQLGGYVSGGFEPMEALNNAALWGSPVQSQGDVSGGQRFGARRSGLRPEECGDGHCGVDLGKAKGTDVYSVGDGVITKVQGADTGSGGRWVEVSHFGGKIKTRYFHLDSVSSDLREGMMVKRGQPLGEVGNTGTGSRGDHLHFEILVQEKGQNSKYVNPESYLERWATDSKAHQEKLAEKNSFSPFSPKEKK
ncbi:MAG: peptidoglycan DD-metalloendopeptidase family protein [Myxococcota bacterium]|nr:peptidoglycan DD-metalloendopeptidase family protein [Myxococcota bacterium]